MKHPKFRHQSWAVALVVLAFVTSLARTPREFAARPQTPPQSRPLPQPRYIPDHDFDTRHVALDLHFNWEHKQLIGVETMTIKPLVTNLKSIDLDAADMTITSVTLVGSGPLKFELDAAKQRLRIALGKDFLPADDLTMVINYHTNGSQEKLPGLVGAALRFIEPTPEDPTRPRQIWSQGESEYNHYWFPVYDHPNDFFTSEITATVEQPLMVVSNGKLLETKDNHDGTRTFHWKIDQPHASYLTSIIVGEYTSIVSDYQGIPIISNVYPSEVKEGKATVARLPEMVKFFSEKTGLKYPYAKYAQTMVRDFGGGMENISATTQTDNMIHDARSELDSNTDGLQAHELAHQWFGDYVTCRDWSDIWLNESFATYFQAMWDEHKLGGDDFLYADVKANQEAYLAAWREGNRRPVVTKNYANPDAVFDTYAYPRGGAVLHMLRRQLGEDNWWRAINYYLHKYANQPVETEQFRIAIEESTGQAMDWFFDEWLYKMGHPVFRVTQSYDPTAKSLTLAVEQLQTVDSSSQFPQVSFFRTPVEVEIGTAAGTRVERVQILPLKEQSFTFAVDSKPLLVNFDFHGTLIKELKFEKSTEDLAYQLANDTDVLGRVWALKQMSARVVEPTTSAPEKQQIASAFVRSVSSDKFWGLRLEAATALARVEGNQAKDALIAATRDADARVRARAVDSLAKSSDPALFSLYQKLLGDPSYAVIKAAALGLGKTRASGAYEALVKLLQIPSWRDTIKISGLAGLESLGDKRALDAALRYAASGNPPLVRAAGLRLLGRVGRDDPRAFPLVANAATQYSLGGNWNLATAAGEALVSLGDTKGLAVLEELARSDAVSARLKKQLGQYQQQLRTVIAGTSPSGGLQP
jgi:aminopeptidase N